MADGNRGFPQRAKNALDVNKLRLSTDPVEGGKQRPSLVWSVVSNNPRITIFTNVDGDRDNGKIQAKMDAPTFYAILTAIREMVNADPGMKIAIDNTGYLFPGGKRSEQPVVLSTTHVGKDQDGVIWIAVTAKDRPKINFKFLPSFWHKMYINGEPASQAEASRRYALAYATMLEHLTSNVMDTHYKETEAGQGGQGGQGGGNRNGGGGGWNGGGNRGGNSGGKGGWGGGNSGGGSNADMDDDIPW